MDPITLTSLAEFPRQLEAHFSAIPPEYGNWAPASWEGIPSEPFTAIGQLAHVRDIEIDGYHLRIHRMLNEANPLLESIDGERLAQVRSYATADPIEVLGAFRLARAKTIALISALTPEQWARPGIFPGYGPLSLHSLVHYLCSHDQQHLAGLQWLLGKIEAFRVAPGIHLP